MKMVNLAWVLLFLGLVKPLLSVGTGFWYSDTRPPKTDYETVAFANMTVKINRPYADGPGQNLVKDPFDIRKSLYVGNTINRQTFDTQFILDLSYALDIDVHRIFVTYVSAGNVHYSWESQTVIVQFIFLEKNQTTMNGPTLLEAVAALTQQVQDPSSKLYFGTNVTKDIDSLWGVQISSWDVSLKLTYAIQIVGGDAVQEGYYLNYGGLGVCDYGEGLQFSTYCEFERFFEDDIAKALRISYYRVQILFIKSAAIDSVLVFFRISPEQYGYPEANVTTAVSNLIIQVPNPTSKLYDGNVTIRVDPTWGVNGYLLPTARLRESRFTYKYYEYDPSRLSSPKRMFFLSAYDRCKANHRCNWGIVEHNQTTNDVRFYQRLFDRGENYPVDLFLDFEDWRLGSRGFSWEGSIPPTQFGATSLGTARAKAAVIAGAHFSPFEQKSLGPDIPCLFLERNQGLILDRQLQLRQVYEQESLVDDLKGRIDWLEENIEWATMDAHHRARKDVRANLTWVQARFRDWWNNEVDELRQLNSSQCVATKCTITFNTSSLELYGAINATGVVRKTSGGTEVAVFSFNSIYLGPETEVLLVGQRAMALVSKSSAIINTTFHAHPGTIGGFQGGGSVARLVTESLTDTPQSIFICDLGDYCHVSRNFTNLTSNNVNGPGSGNVRVTPFVVVTSADPFREIQVITTTAQRGQTLGGGFRLHFRGYSTPTIPHDITADGLKKIMEDNLNLAKPENYPVLPDRLGAALAGIGEVEISRSLEEADDQEGFVWSITFSTSIGNREQMTVTSFLTGLLANVTVHTARDGNEILGTFTLSFRGETTAPISVRESAQGMKQKLLALPSVQTAHVTRNDPTENCLDGLCPDGPEAAAGMRWTIYVTSDLNHGDTTPTSPTSPITKSREFHHQFTADTTNVLGVNATVTIYRGLAQSGQQMMSQLYLPIPFSLAFGGAGASYGGRGGAGHGENPVGPTYNSERLNDLLGGSGGCMRSQHPYEINAAKGPTTGRGGHGGGAFEIIAANDIFIGTHGILRMRGEDGQQSSGGGGGGGSGGAVLLSAGGVVVNDGLIDVSGGDGGFGGLSHPELAGGGGGGGRVAVYGQSITVTGKIRLDGGHCGIFKIPSTVPVWVIDATILVIMVSPVDDSRLAYIAANFVNSTMPTMQVTTRHVQSYYFNESYRSAVSLRIVVQREANDLNVSDTQVLVTETLRSGWHNNYAEVFFANSFVTSVNATYHTFTLATNTKCSNNGEKGTFFTQTKMTSLMVVRPTLGAEGSKRALFFSNREETKTASGSTREAPFSWNGPIMPFEPSQPNRITFYVRVDAVPGESKKSNFGALFSLLSRGVEGLNVSSVIGVFIGDRLLHGANFGSAVDEKTYLKRLVTIWEYPAVDRWYKVDIHINWRNHTYYILLDDSIVAQDAPFTGDDVDGIRISVTRAVDVWYDEIYVGFDNMMGFTCPFNSRKGTATVAPEQRHWSFQEVHGGDSNGYTEYKKMTRHYSHLDPTGSIPFDGQGFITNNQDIKFDFGQQGDIPITQGKLHAGALKYLTNSLRSAKSPSGASNTLVSPSGLWYAPKDGIGGAGDGRQFWYTEYSYIDKHIPTLNGGIAACSSQDLVTWRFEGFVFKYANLSDMVFGSEGPFYVERPRVEYNFNTSNYVMWAVMDNGKRNLALSAVFTSPYEDGPFLFRRSFYPDGNATRDQVIFVNDEKKGVVGRTYFQTVEYLLPEAMMQPVWESVKFRNGTVNFRSSYHRAFYDVGYDNYHDVFLQRWRNESKPWDVICVNKITGENRSVAAGVYNSQSTVCNDPDEYKVVFGQGDPVVPSLFLDPSVADNSWWTQTSVPAVLAQPWASSYRDGYCGIRQLDDNYDKQDPALASFDAHNRSACSNIADNPVHVSKQDKLIGVQRVVTSRRAKFIAISELTYDYLDTSGILNSFEGELGGQDMISLIVQMGQFGFSAGEQLKSTFRAPVRSEFETAIDYEYRFKQYIRNFNDRATYALACVLDGVCPVNFKDQINVK